MMLKTGCGKVYHKENDRGEYWASYICDKGHLCPECRGYNIGYTEAQEETEKKKDLLKLQIITTSPKYVDHTQICTIIDSVFENKNKKEKEWNDETKDN